MRLTLGAFLLVVAWVCGTVLLPVLEGKRGPCPVWLGVLFQVACAALICASAAAVFWDSAVRRRWILAASVLFLLLECELACRIRNNVASAGLVEENATCGWQPLSGGKWNSTLPEIGPVSISTHANGFRKWGDPKTRKFKLLIVGDSYTHALYISDGKTYFDQLQQARPDIEVFAFGCAGYSALQVYLKLKQWVNEIKPDLILWEFVHGRIIAATPECETHSRWNDHVVRPYLVDGEVKFLYAKETRRGIFRLCRYSAFLRQLDHFRTRWRARRAGWNIEMDLKPWHPVYRRARDVVSQVFDMARQVTGNTPIAGFVAANNYDWDGTFPSLCHEHGFAFLDGIDRAVKDEEKRGKKVTLMPMDSHWNTEGHAVAAKAILKQFMDQKLLPPKL